MNIDYEGLGVFEEFSAKQMAALLNNSNQHFDDWEFNKMRKADYKYAAVLKDATIGFFIQDA